LHSDTKDDATVAPVVCLSKSSTPRPNPQEAQSIEDSTPPLNINEIAPEALFISPPSGIFPDIQVVTNTLNTQQTFTLHALLDSGAMSSFVDSSWVQKESLSLDPLLTPQKVFNANSTQNNCSMITHQVQLRIAVQGHVCLKWFFVTNLGKSKEMIIGINWLMAVDLMYNVELSISKAVVIYVLWLLLAQGQVLSRSLMHEQSPQAQ